MGFGHSRRQGDDEEAINRIFTPEFRNRLDAIIAFGALPTEVVHKVVQKFVLQLEGQLADRGVTFELDDKAIAWLAERGYDERMGARPLGRLIQEEIKKPLAEEVLFGKLQKGGIVKVSVEDKAEGGTGLKLESIPDENAQRKEKPLRAPKGEPEEGGPPRSRPAEGGGSVPRVPLKA
jgi:ATP-dependent Clp protease ATP-binding subunit ClpA